MTSWGSDMPVRVPQPVATPDPQPVDLTTLARVLELLRRRP